MSTPSTATAPPAARRRFGWGWLRTLGPFIGLGIVVLFFAFMTGAPERYLSITNLPVVLGERARRHLPAAAVDAGCAGRVAGGGARAHHDPGAAQYRLRTARVRARLERSRGARVRHRGETAQGHDLRLRRTVLRLSRR